MITLKTLHEATEQQVFDQVATHLLTQMEKSEDESNCLYRGPRGLKCAAGCLIGDDEYRYAMDGNDGLEWYKLVESGVAPETHMGLIGNLQKVHDNYLPENWMKNLRIVALRRKLNEQVLVEFSKRKETE